MRIYLDRAFDFFIPNHEPWIEVELHQPTCLRDILAQIGIPFGEVHLVVVNGEAIEARDMLIKNEDNLKIFPPFGGG